MGGISNMELYRLPSGSKQLDLVGDIKAKCTIQRTHAKKGVKKATKHEPLRTTQILDPNDLKKRTKTTQPPRRAPSPLPSVATSGNAGAVVPLKTRVIQLLALQPLGLSELQSKVGPGDLQMIMPMVATLSGGKYILKAEAYREVKIYDWKNYSAKQREVVVKNASTAFDKLGLRADAIERSKLLPEKVHRQSPPLVAEGYHVAGTMDSHSKWKPNGGGSESEGPENGKSGLLKPPSGRKKASTKKSPATLLPSKKKVTSSSTKSTTKASVRSLDIATIMDQVPNHSAKVGASTLKPPESVHAIGSPNVTTRRPSVSAPNGNSVSAVIPKKGSEARKTSGGNKDSGGVGNGYKIPKVGSGTTLPRKPPSLAAFVVPPIRSQSEYEEVSKLFTDRYDEMKQLKVIIDEKRILLEELKVQLEKAIGTDREPALKRKVQEAFGHDTVDRRVLRLNGEPRNGVSTARAAAARIDKMAHMSIKTMTERYKTLHAEAEMIKTALVEARAAAAAAVAAQAANH